MFAGNYVMGDGQSLAGALADLLRGEKRIENLALDMFGDADARIGNSYFHLPVVLPGAYRNPAFFPLRIMAQLILYGMGGIDQQVEKNLAHLVGKTWY